MTWAERNRVNLILAVVALAAASRGIAIWHFDSIANDQDAYLAIGKNIAAGNGFCANVNQPTAFRPPLYPLLVALTEFLGGAKTLAACHVILGMLTAAMTWRLAQSCGLTIPGAAVASACVAVDPILVRYSASPMTETLFTFLLIGLAQAIFGWRQQISASRAAGLQRSRLACQDNTAPNRNIDRSAAIAGVWFGLAALCRPSVWAFAGLFSTVVVCRCVLLGKSEQPTSETRSASTAKGRLLTEFRLSAWLILAALVVISPWVIRNWFVFGKPIFMTTHGGYTLALSNNPAFAAHVKKNGIFSIWPEADLAGWQQTLERKMESRGIAPIDEVRRSEFFQSEAISWLKESPSRVFTMGGIRLLRFWNPTPQGAESLGSLKFIVGVFYVIQFLFVGICIFRGKNIQRFSVLCVIVMSVAVLHSLYWSNARMRGPIQPFLAVIAVGLFSNQHSPRTST